MKRQYSSLIVVAGLDIVVVGLGQYLRTELRERAWIEGALAIAAIVTFFGVLCARLPVRDRSNLSWMESIRDALAVTLVVVYLLSLATNVGLADLSGFLGPVVATVISVYIGSAAYTRARQSESHEASGDPTQDSR